MLKNYKYLLKNIGILTIGNFTTKLLNFFLIPLYTAVLSTTEYGEYDLLNTTIGLFIPIFTLNIYEGIFRYALDRETDKGNLIVVAVKYFLISLLPFALLVMANVQFNIIPTFNKYLKFFVLMYIFNSLSAILTGIAKGLEKLKIIAASGVLSSLVIIIANLILLLVLNIGIEGYFIANIIGVVTQCIYVLVGIKIWKYCPDIILKGKDYKTLENKIVTYSRPLIANSIGWWINNVSDRYVITFLCGLSINGIYSIAYKIPTFLNVLVSIFNQAWNLSAIKDFVKDDKNGFFSKTYTMYNCFMVLMCSVIIIFNKVLARVFYSNDFYSAWVYVPFLLIAFYFGAISGYIGAIFAAVNRTDIYAKSTVMGALINTILNFLLVYKIGSIGAAIATLVSYFTVWLIRYYYMKKIISLKIKIKRDIFAYCILVIQAIFMIVIRSSVYMYLSQVMLFAIAILIFLGDIKSIVRNLFREFRRRT